MKDSKLNPNTSKDFVLLQETFIANQNQYRSIVAKYIRERNLAYMVATIMFIVMLISVGITTYLSTQAKVQAVIFNQDGEFIGIPNVRVRINNEAIIANQLIAYISGVYGVPADAISKEQSVTKVVSMTDDAYFNSHVLPIIRGNLLNYKDQQVEVRVTYIKPVDGIWNIDFDTYSGTTRLKSYTSRINFRQDLNLDNNEKILNNPLGIYVTSIETGEKFQ
ncbi:MAG: type IV secretion system protein [Burkholderiales bacterium]|nr:type IV secretion system protein [Burkholderiales bacterium]